MVDLGDAELDVDEPLCDGLVLVADAPVPVAVPVAAPVAPDLYTHQRYLF